jgi:hypothetical protein
MPRLIPHLPHSDQHQNDEEDENLGNKGRIHDGFGLRVDFETVFRGCVLLKCLVWKSLKEFCNSVGNDRSLIVLLLSLVPYCRMAGNMGRKSNRPRKSGRR